MKKLFIIAAVALVFTDTATAASKYPSWAGDLAIDGLSVFGIVAGIYYGFKALTAWIEQQKTHFKEWVLKGAAEKQRSIIKAEEEAKAEDRKNKVLANAENLIKENQRLQALVDGQTAQVQPQVEPKKQATAKKRPQPKAEVLEKANLKDYTFFTFSEKEVMNVKSWDCFLPHKGTSYPKLYFTTIDGAKLCICGASLKGKHVKNLNLSNIKTLTCDKKTGASGKPVNLFTFT